MFNVGDKIRRIRGPEGKFRGINRKIGSIYTVSHAHPRATWLALVGQTENGDPLPFDGGCFELVKDAPKPHVHAEVIKAWADGAKIQFHTGDKNDNWEDTSNPMWLGKYRYRIKPEPKPDRSLVCRVAPYCDQVSRHGTDQVKATELSGWDVRAIMDGETGELKAVELIK